MLKRKRPGLVYRRDGRVVLRTGLLLAEIVLGKVQRRCDGWHFLTTRIAPSDRAVHRESLGLAPDPFEFECDGHAYPTRHAASAALLQIYCDGAAADLDARRGLSGDDLEPPRNDPAAPTPIGGAL